MRPDGRLDADEHVLVRRAEDGAGSLGADVAGPEADVRADAGARAAGEECGAAVESRVARIAARVERVVAVAVQRVVIRGHRRIAGHPVRELGHARLRDDDRAGIAQIFRERRFVRRNIAVERQRAAGRRHVRRHDVVFDRDGNAVQRTADLAGFALGIERVRFLHRVRIDVDRRVEAVLVHADAHEVLRDEIVRSDAAAAHRFLHLGDRRFDDAERLRGFFFRSREQRGSQKENDR
jgi:hypothetical protein